MSNKIQKKNTKINTNSNGTLENPYVILNSA